MVAIKLIVALVAACSVSSVAAFLPVPPRPQGVPIGNAANLRTVPAAPKVVVDAFLDPLCPDSLAAFPAIKQLAAYYPPSEVVVRVNLFPLPYHRNAHISTIAAFAVAGAPGLNANGTLLEQYLDLVYGSLSKFTSETRILNEFQVRELFADSVNKRFGINAESFLTAILAGSDNDIFARYAWKYATTRAISGTPQYLINGVLDIDPEEFLTLRDWNEYLSPFIKGTPLLQQ